MPHTYDFNITDTLNNKVDPKALHAQVFELTVGTLETPGVLDKALDGVVVEGDTIHITFSGELTDRAPLDVSVASHDGEPLPSVPAAKLTESGHQRVQVEPREGTPYQDFSINFCDPRTWWPESKKVQNATMEEDTNDPSGKTFKFMDTDGTTHRKWIIDLDNGLLTQEHKIHGTYGVSITVGGNVQTQQEFDYREDAPTLSISGKSMDNGDYVLDAENGTVTFHEVPSETPVASYHYAWECVWYITPSEGRALTLLAVEIQFTDDVQPRSDIYFQPQIMAAYAAAGGMLDDLAAPLGMPDGTYLLASKETEASPYYSAAATALGITVEQLKAAQGLPLADTSYLDDPDYRRYRRLHDFMCESQRTYPTVQALGGLGKRAIQYAMHTLRWPYDEEAARVIDAKIGTRLKVYVNHDIPFLGDYASVSVYALSTNGT